MKLTVGLWELAEVLNRGVEMGWVPISDLGWRIEIS